MNAIITRAYEPPNDEDSGCSGYATLEHGGHTYTLSYSARIGLSVTRKGDFPDAAGLPSCGINYDERDQLKPGYWTRDRRWVDVPLLDADREVRRWAEANFYALFGLGPDRETDRTPWHKPEGCVG
ncbi:MAG TPA: hypothetical protein VKY26_05240 [Actinomycetota bacterium]|nr:hypothetical protein [Actinomycetota bacterium]